MEQSLLFKAAPAPQRGLSVTEIGLMTIGSAALLLAAATGWWALSITEALGFATGGTCVWLCVREHIWNWPLGLANNVVFCALFWHSRLYADMGLQAVYFAFGIYGWWNWLFGGQRQGGVEVSRTPPGEILVIAALAPIATWGLWLALVEVHDAAPFLDALTTVLSLIAQYLLCRKRIENWLAWILVDAIYVPLYLSRDLQLTALLYALFLVMCIYGLRAWMPATSRVRVPS
ncbi:MAG: nicotinamide riboside transporter PnuC [Thermoanaerobaculia bacterium]